MRLKIYVIELSPGAKRGVVAAAALAATLIGLATAVAAPAPFSAGEVLSAEKVNANFAGLDQRLSAVEVSAPPGTVVAYGGAVAPSGWLLCDGQAASRTSNKALWDAIGTSFGAGDGVLTFNVPDLRGRFVRGVDHGAGHDPDRTARAPSATGGNAGDGVGSLQLDQLKDHAHGLLTQNGNFSAGGGGPQVLGGSTAFSTLGAGGSETRPANVYLNYIIKL